MAVRLDPVGGGEPLVLAGGWSLAPEALAQLMEGAWQAWGGRTAPGAESQTAANSSAL